MYSDPPRPLLSVFLLLFFPFLAPVWPGRGTSTYRNTWICITFRSISLPICVFSYHFSGPQPHVGPRRVTYGIDTYLLPYVTTSRGGRREFRLFVCFWRPCLLPSLLRANVFIVHLANPSPPRFLAHTSRWDISVHTYIPYIY